MEDDTYYNISTLILLFPFVFLLIHHYQNYHNEDHDESATGQCNDCTNAYELGKNYCILVKYKTGIV